VNDNYLIETVAERKMNNKMFYRYAQKRLCTIKNAGEKELRDLLISYDFPISFSGDFVKYIFSVDVTVSEKLIRAKEKIDEMNEARHAALLGILDAERKSRDDRQAWKDAELQRQEYNKQQQEQEDQRMKNANSFYGVIIIAAMVLLSYFMFGAK
jgi:hypothetical protein